MTFIYSHSLLPDRSNKGYNSVAFIYLHFLLPEKKEKKGGIIQLCFTFPSPGQIKQRVLFNNLCSRCLLSDRSLPWYNRNGWLGVKHQVLPTDQTKGISQQRFFIHLLRNACARMRTPHAISTLIFVPQFRLTCRSPGRRHPQRGWPACTHWAGEGWCSAGTWVWRGGRWTPWNLCQPVSAQQEIEEGAED